MPEKNGSLRISMKWVGLAVAVVSVGGAAIGAGNHVMDRLARHDTAIAIQAVQIVALSEASAIAVRANTEAVNSLREDMRGLTQRIDSFLVEKRQ